MTLTIEKSQRYDRQLRLWGDNGQLALEKSHICIIGCDSVGSEVAKNLILPGIGKITIIDDVVVSDNDLSNNFFLMERDLGKSRAECCCKWLKELNDEVIVQHLEDSIKSLLIHKPERFQEYSVIVACGLDNNDLLQLDRLLYTNNIPLIVCHTIGMIGSVRLVIREHYVWDTHPENSKPDLRLDYPFPELDELCTRQNLDLMNHKELSQCPWLILLKKYSELFQKQEGRWPTTYKDRCLLKQMLKDASNFYRLKFSEQSGDETTNDTGLGGASIDGDQFDSFDEAIKAVNTALGPTEIPQHIQELIRESRAMNITRESSPFWILLRSLSQFVEDNTTTTQGQLPLSGHLPDMTCDTQRYTQLQRLYRSRADCDAELFARQVQLITQAYGIDAHEELSTANIYKFAKNCTKICLISTGSLEREMKRSPAYSDEIVCAETDELSWYLSLRATVCFYTSEGRWPSHSSEDLSLLRQTIDQMSGGGGTGASVKYRARGTQDEYLQEMCRYSGGLQLHCVGAVLGGIVAQEVVKLVTGQFVPICRPLVYNGITQMTNFIDL